MLYQSPCNKISIEELKNDSEDEESKDPADGPEQTYEDFLKKKLEGKKSAKEALNKLVK